MNQSTVKKSEYQLDDYPSTLTSLCRTIHNASYYLLTTTGINEIMEIIKNSNNNVSNFKFKPTIFFSDLAIDPRIIDKAIPLKENFLPYTISPIVKKHSDLTEDTLHVVDGIVNYYKEYPHTNFFLVLEELHRKNNDYNIFNMFFLDTKKYIRFLIPPMTKLFENNTISDYSQYAVKVRKNYFQRIFDLLKYCANDYKIMDHFKISPEVGRIVSKFSFEEITLREYLIDTLI